MEHDPTIGLASALLPPTLVTPELLGALLIATGAIVTAVAFVKWKKKTINVVVFVNPLALFLFAV